MLYENPLYEAAAESGRLYRDSYLCEKTKKHIQVMVFEEGSEGSQLLDESYHPLYLDAVRRLNEELPVLRKTYGACESAPRVF